MEARPLVDQSVSRVGSRPRPPETMHTGEPLKDVTEGFKTREAIAGIRTSIFSAGGV